MKIAILAVHGVLPRLRHTFQDQVASALQDRLNRTAKVPHWTMSAVFARPGDASGTVPSDGPAIVRLHRVDDDPSEPVHDVFDVQEVYWSPLVRGKSTALAVLGWLLRTALSPLNTTARCRETPQKALFDAGLILAGVAAIAGFCAFAAVVTVKAWIHITNVTGNHAPPWQQPRAVSGFVIGLGAAYVFGVGIRSAYAVARSARALLREPIQLWSRSAAIICLLVVSIAGFAFSWWLISAGATELVLAAVALVCAVAAASSVLRLAQWFLVAFFGPPQVYTTRDTNAALFACREQVIALFTDALMNTLRTPTDAPGYDRVYIVAHSLGSSIAMDGIFRIFNLSRDSATAGDALHRLRGFITIGSSLEKSKYFIDAAHEHDTFSLRFDQWRNDLYGTIFTADRASLDAPTAAAGIYWLNCWYFSDIIADAIASYRSFLLPGEAPETAIERRKEVQAVARRTGQHLVGRLVAENRHRFGNWWPWRPITHEDYLDDDWFWLRRDSQDIGALDVVTSRTSPAGAILDVHRTEPARRRWWWPPDTRDIAS